VEEAVTADEAAKAVTRALMSFGFDDYGMDDVEEAKDEEWLPDLVIDIVFELEQAGLLNGGSPSVSGSSGLPTT
jgi:hypothetical protein